MELGVREEVFKRDSFWIKNIFLKGCDFSFFVDIFKIFGKLSVKR